VQKTIRDHQAIKLIKEGGLDKLLITDFSKLASEIATIRLTLAQKEKDKESKADAKPKEEDKKKSSENTENKESIKFDGSNYNALSESELNKLLKEKRKELDNFFDGKKGEAILYKTLSGATPEIKDAVGLISLYKYAYLKYGKEYKDLDSSGTVTKKSVEEEYNKWKKETNAVKRFLTLGADAFGDFDSRFSEYVVDYVKSRYAEARNISYEKVYSNKNFEIDSLLNEEKAYNLIKHLSNTLKGD
jgi:hypothetical protein